jgi:DNA repair exonuclease SbcCD nuclease subunit
MIDKIIMIADIHIKCNRLHDEYEEVLTNFINDIKPICDDKTLIYLAGDTFDNFINISNELLIKASWFLKELDRIAPTIVIAGNHDLTRSNLTKMDTLTPIFKMVPFKQTRYLDMELGYNSGIIEFDKKYSFALYSIFDGYREPDIESYKKENPNKVVIGLFHGALIGSKTPIGFTMDKGIQSDIFKDCNIVLAGDIHMPQTILLKNKVKFHYSGSMISQNFGEKIDGHGYSIISLPDFKIEHVEVENPYKLYSFSVDSLDDIENDREVLKNK